VAPDKPKDKTLAELNQLMQTHLSPKPLEIAERFRFHKRDQHDNESVAEYVAELRRLADTCNFGAYLNNALRDRLVCGLRSEAVQKRLLTEEKLTFDKAQTVAISMEVATRDAQELARGRHQMPGTVNKLRMTRGATKQHDDKKKSSEQKSCYRCGGSHHPQKCKFIKAKCFTCNKVGHIGKMCRLKTSSTHQVMQDDPGDEFDIHTLYQVRKESEDLRTTVSIDGHCLDMEIDTGAARSVVPETFWRNKLGAQALDPPGVKLRSYCNAAVKLLGQTMVNVKYQNQDVKVAVLVVEGNKPPLLGRDWMKVIKLDWVSMFSVKVTGSVDNIIRQFPGVFSSEHGAIKGFKANIRLKDDVKPMFVKARTVPYALREGVEKELDRLQAAGIIYPVNHSEWASPTVNVPKTGGSIRMCGDYKVTVNRYLDVEQYPLPTAEDIFATMAGGKVFSKIDLANAYQQLELDEEAQVFSTINTCKGLFRYSRLNFGLASAPAIFQMVMDQVLQGVERTCCYLDDILISARSEQEHDKLLTEVLRRLFKHGIVVNPKKCEFRVDSVTYLGHRIDQNGLHPTDEKIEDMVAAPAPKNEAELRSWLGLVNYYSRFMPNLSSKLRPLNELLKKDVSWKWSVECEQAFLNCKLALKGPNVLAHYDAKQPISLACDASAYGVGAVISHVLQDGSDRPIAFASRTLSSSERNYSQIEKEALALKFGVKRFHKYLYGRQFTLITDHKPLMTILGPKTGIPSLAAARMQRWALILAAYHYDIKFRSSQANANADAMSRLPCTSTNETGECPSLLRVSFGNELPVQADDVKEATRKDPVMAKVLDYTLSGWPTTVEDPILQPYIQRRDELSVDQGCLLWGMRVVIPPQYRQRLLEELHGEHQGVSRTKTFARSYMWWPGMDSEIESMVRGCAVCQTVQKMPAKAPLQPWPWPTRVWQRIHIDFAEKDQQMMLVLIDSHSKWIEVFPMKSTTSTKTIEILRVVFARYGFPEELVSDNGPQFISTEFQAFVRNNGITHKFSPPYHPATNGAAERAVQTVKQALTKQVLDKHYAGGPSLNHRLANFLMVYRSTPHSVTKRTPAELFLKREMRTKFTLLKPSLERTVLERQIQQKRYHDQKVKNRRFCVNDQVYVRNHRGGIEKWVPGVVTKCLGTLTYLVRVGGKTRYVHCEHLAASGSQFEERGEEERRASLPLQIGTPMPYQQYHSPTVGHPLEGQQVGEKVTVEGTTVTPVVTPVAKNGTTDQTVVTTDEPSHRYPGRIRKPPRRLDL